MKNWTLNLLLAGLLLAPVTASADPAEIKVVVTTDEDGPVESGDVFTIVACTGQSEVLHLWAQCADEVSWPNGVNVGQWTFGSVDEGEGDDVEISDWKIDPAWKQEGCLWLENDDVIAWDCGDGTGGGVIIPSDEYILLGYAAVTVAADCDRLSQTHTNVLGWSKDHSYNWLDTVIGPEEVTRELTPDCEVSPGNVVCPSALPFCWDNEDCEISHPERNHTCGECGSNPDCVWPEVCVCGVCEFAIE